jgi:hypothetical protein
MVVVETTTIVIALDEFILLALYYFVYSRSISSSISRSISSSKINSTFV